MSRRTEPRNFSWNFRCALRNALTKTDSHAFSTVTHDENGGSIVDRRGRPIPGKNARGGPFGATICISYDDVLEPIGDIRGNSVISTGIASNHAEDQVMRPDMYRLLCQRLRCLNVEGKNPFVWMISSGQSCTTCHTKQEIMARDLVRRGLTESGSFCVLYGATYDETFQKAQFYDVQYADAMIFFSQNRRSPDNLIKHEKIDFLDAPFLVQETLRKAPSATAIVMRDDDIFALGRDGRTPYDLFSTPEVSAIRKACLREKEAGRFDAWAVDGVLYTTTQQIGPLLFAEAGWTNITTILSVAMPDGLSGRAYETQETPDLSNEDFLQLVAKGYTSSAAAIRVYRDMNFKNTAQRQWAEMLKVNRQQLYNGAAVRPQVEAMRNDFTRYRFAARSIDAPSSSKVVPLNPCYPSL